MLLGASKETEELKYRNFFSVKFVGMLVDIVLKFKMFIEVNNILEYERQMKVAKALMTDPLMSQNFLNR